MNSTLFPKPVANFPAPREDPLKYPGKRPGTSFVVANGYVWPIVYDEKDKGSPGSIYSGRVVSDSKGQFSTINDFLVSRKTDPLEARFPVIGYGSNPVPGQLLSKLGNEAVVPVILGTLKNSDVVYNLISNKGYAFAEMIIGGIGSEGNVAVTFLDHRQLKIMIETEQNYRLAYLPTEVKLESGEKLSPRKGNALYIFAGFRKIWVPVGYDCPIAISELPSNGRKLKALTQIETLKLVIEQFNLTSIGISTPQALAKRIREEARLDEKPGKLKYNLQKAVEEAPCSLSPLADSLTLVAKEISLKPFGSN